MFDSTESTVLLSPANASADNANAAHRMWGTEYSHRDEPLQCRNKSV